MVFKYGVYTLCKFSQVKSDSGKCSVKGSHVTQIYKNLIQTVFIL